MHRMKDYADKSWLNSPWALFEPHVSADKAKLAVIAMLLVPLLYVNIVGVLSL